MEQVLIDYIWKILLGVAVFLLVKYLDHEKRIQKMEDVQGLKIDALVKKVEDLEVELNLIKNEVHINKDLVNQMKGTIFNVNKWIEKQHEKHNQ
jgi:hypothetical protein